MQVLSICFGECWTVNKYFYFSLLWVSVLFWSIQGFFFGNHLTYNPLFFKDKCWTFDSTTFILKGAILWNQHLQPDQMRQILTDPQYHNISMLFCPLWEGGWLKLKKWIILYSLSPFFSRLIRLGLIAFSATEVCRSGSTRVCAFIRGIWRVMSLCVTAALMSKGIKKYIYINHFLNT